MLRNFLLGLTLIVTLIGLMLGLLFGVRQGWPVAIWGSVLFLLTALERWRYVRSGPVGDAGWVATDEQFVDPESGKLVRVYFHAGSGERKYEVQADSSCVWSVSPRR